jgi:hypothetical protein
MNYKLKYLKYKSKYLDNKYLLSGGTIYNIQVITNNGNCSNLNPTIPNTQYSNQCIWISILDYLKLNRFSEFSEWNLDKIRNIASSNNTPINSNLECFDFDIHEIAIQNVVNYFNINIRIYTPFWKNNIIRDNNLQINDFTYLEIKPINQLSNQLVNIISYGNHFELITNISENNDNNTSNSTVFKPDIKLAYESSVDKEISDKISINDKSDKVNNILLELNNIDQEITFLLNQIKNIDNEIKTYKFFIENNIEDVDTNEYNTKIKELEITKKNLQSKKDTLKNKKRRKNDTLKKNL